MQALTERASTYEEVKAVYDKYYENEKFVRVLDEDVCPETKWVEGSNYVDVNFKIDPRTAPPDYDGCHGQSGKRCGRTGCAEYEPAVWVPGKRRSASGSYVSVK